MHRTRCFGLNPRLFCGEGKNRCQQSAKRVENSMHRCLRRAAARRIGSVAIHPIFRDIDVERTEIDSAEAINCMINLMEFKCLVCRSAVLIEICESIENPSIQQSEFWFLPSLLS